MYEALRLVQNMVENELDLARIQRIRAYYHRRLAGEHDFFADAVQGEGNMRATWAAVGNAPRRAQLLLTTAAMVGAVNALLVGLAVTLLARLAGLSSAFAIGVGTVFALLAFAAQVAYINRESGKKKIVLARSVHNDRLIDVPRLTSIRRLGSRVTA
ncbi:hypothetical protein EV384_4691 [Micromonospora kangleipakensis]|uniref:Uncharacterized protein n=1 Tax=Micromonospora kangleipakensis TaxID=1077942 RepID=A0A4V2GDI4_9ACTN|nr:hypothetical protein [Micromonospora kangleipakensis]RZU76086.1 hypothetical protein EV384_4691 [Micromonospora kangleipakensis]